MAEMTPHMEQTDNDDNGNCVEFETDALTQLLHFVSSEDLNQQDIEDISEHAHEKYVQTDKPLTVELVKDLEKAVDERSQNEEPEENEPEEPETEAGQY